MRYRKKIVSISDSILKLNHIYNMIESFFCKHTENVLKGIRTKKWSDDIANDALRKLMMINAATDIKDFKIPPSNRLHNLNGNWKDYWAISINDQWRIIFIWENPNALEVQSIDYH